MNNITIVFGYRNRETKRIKKCFDSLVNQTNKGFSVIFIDYGSDKEFAKRAKELCANYPFIKYTYSHTIGMPWNRSHALNTGIRLVDSEYTLLSDIDMIYHPYFMEELLVAAHPKKQYFKPFYFLPEDYSEFDGVFEDNNTSFPDSGKASKGGIQFVPTKALKSIQGFDEFYCFWGVEDRDLWHRLSNIEIATEWLPLDKSPVYHQWHPIASNTKKGFFPDRWWDDMNLHFYLNKEINKRNSNDWGKIYTSKDRQSYKAFSSNNFTKTLEPEDRTDSYYKSGFLKTLFKELEPLKKGDTIAIKVNKKVPKKPGNLLKNTEKILKKILPSYTLKEKIELDKLENAHQYFNPVSDVYYLTWSLIKKHQLVSDYVLVDDEESLQIILSR